MLGFVHVGQPTVLFRVSSSFSEDAWICAPRATDRDLGTVSASFSVNAWTCARRSTDRDLQSFSAMKKVNAWICAPRTTDHDLANAVFNNICNSCNVCNFSAAVLFSN